MLKVFRQGEVVVVRDDENRIVRHPDGKQAKAVVVSRSVNKETWRKALNRMTDNGRILDERLLNLALGHAYTASLPDGRVSDPIIPTPEVSRAATVDLLHMMRGKPVAQTEVMKAEKEAEDMEQYQAMSDEQLKAIIEGEFKLESGEEIDPEDSPSDE